jgi:2,3-dihydroxybenzoate decarboxylase
VNDLLASAVAENPAGFAALPLQDPQAAAREPERAVTQLGFRGAMVNAHTQGRYLDDPVMRVVWESAVSLDVPLYLHPANGVDVPHVMSGHPELIGPMWSWGPDTASHVLRLIFGGVFDDFPEAKLLVGHMGEGLPYALWRLDSRWSFCTGRPAARWRPYARWFAALDADVALVRPDNYVFGAAKADRLGDLVMNSNSSYPSGWISRECERCVAR